MLSTHSFWSIAPGWCAESTLTYGIGVDEGGTPRRSSASSRINSAAQRCCSCWSLTWSLTSVGIAQELEERALERPRFCRIHALTQAQLLRRGLPVLINDLPAITALAPSAALVESFPEQIRAICDRLGDLSGCIVHDEAIEVKHDLLQVEGRPTSMADRNLLLAEVVQHGLEISGKKRMLVQIGSPSLSSSIGLMLSCAQGRPLLLPAHSRARERHGASVNMGRKKMAATVCGP